MIMLGVQKLLLITVAVCNLVVGAETSSDVEDVWLKLGLLETLTTDLNQDPGGDGLDDSDCDHCCHASAHTVAFAVLPINLERPSTASSIGLGVELRSRTGRAPPLPPPIV